MGVVVLLVAVVPFRRDFCGEVLPGVLWARFWACGHVPVLPAHRTCLCWSPCGIRVCGVLGVWAGKK